MYFKGGEGREKGEMKREETREKNEKRRKRRKRRKIVEKRMSELKGEKENKRMTEFERR